MYQIAKKFILTTLLTIGTIIASLATNNLYNSSYTGPTIIRAGQAFDMYYDVNRSDWFGSWSALTFQINSYISLDNKYDPGVDVLLKSRTINLDVNGAEQVGVNYSVSLPSGFDLPGGRLYYITIVDPTNVVAESDETDNIKVQAFYYSVAGVDAAAIDWTNINADYYSADPVMKASLTLMNSGNTTLTNLSYNVIVGTDSNNISSTVYKKTYTLASISTNPYLYTRTENINLDSLNLPTGKYYLFLQIDPDNSVTELYENNNIFIKSFRYTKLEPTTSTDLRMPVTGKNVIQTCNAVLYDDGGESGNYTNNSRGQLKIYPTGSNNKVYVRINQFASESGADVLYLYDYSVGTSAVKSYTGTPSLSLNEGYTSKGKDGSVDLYYYTDGSAVNSGFKITIGCIYVDPTKQNQTITFGSLPSKVMTDGDFSLTASSSSGLPITYTSSNTAVATITNGMVTLVGPGTTTITASQEGDNTYNSAEPVLQNLTVTKAAQTITFNNFTGNTYVTDPPITLTANASSDLPVTFVSSNSSIATISGNTLTIVGSGTVTITAQQAGNSIYNAATNVARSLTITKLSQTITFDAIGTKVYGDNPFILNATSSSGLPITFNTSNSSVATVSGDVLTIVSAGTVTIYALQNGDPTYASTSTTQTLVIGKAAQTITFNPLVSKVVGDPSFALNSSSSSGLAITYTSSNNSVATVSGTTVTIVGPGTTTITASQAGNTKYLAAPAVTQNLIVSKKDQTISFDPIPSTEIGGPDFTLFATSSSGLDITYSSSDLSVATISGNAVTIIGVGTATITATQAGNDTYNAVSAQQSFTVTKKSQTIQFDPLVAKPYGSADFNLTATASSELPVNFVSSDPSVAMIVNGIVTIKGVGTITITANQDGNDSFAPSSTTQSFTVTKASQTITFDPLDPKETGSPDFALAATSSAGLTISYTSSDPSVATVKEGVVTIVGKGSTTITAYQDGSDLFEPATSVAQVLVVSGPTGVIDPEFLSCHLYPVPASDYLIITIQFKEDDKAKLELLESASGKIVLTLEQSIAKGISEWRLPVSDIKAGHYIFKLYLGNSVMSRHVVVNH